MDLLPRTRIMELPVVQGGHGRANRRFCRRTRSCAAACSSVFVAMVVLVGTTAAALWSGGARAEAVEPTSSSPGLRCDGTDPFFFAELEQAGSLGYGETWDETVCDEGVAYYAEGASTRWRAMRTPKVPRRASDEEQMWALVMPVVVVGGMGAVFLAAAALAASARMRKRIILDVPCPACSASLPIPLEDVSARQLFCPMCGVACAVDVRGRGKEATGVARLLV